MLLKNFKKPKQEKTVPTGDQLLDTLLYKEKNGNYDEIQEDDLYLALQNCKELMSNLPEDYYESGHSVPEHFRPLSPHQMACVDATIKCIMRKEYFGAICKFTACITDGGCGISREISVNEFSMYNSILTCFIEKIKENKGEQ